MDGFDDNQIASIKKIISEEAPSQKAAIIAEIKQDYVLVKKVWLAVAVFLLAAGGVGTVYTAWQAAKSAITNSSVQVVVNHINDLAVQAERDAKTIHAAGQPWPANPLRLGNFESFTAESDGFIYVECSNKVKSCLVLIEADRSSTSGYVMQNHSAIFPILRGQQTSIPLVDPSDPGKKADVNSDLIIRFYPR